jgi:hypothetical protein
MSKAEEYIKAYTRGCSNELVGGGYHEWLTPENALAAVELAREEMKKDAIDTRIDKRLADMIGYTGSERVKVIIIKE